MAYLATSTWAIRPVVGIPLSMTCASTGAWVIVSHWALTHLPQMWRSTVNTPVTASEVKRNCVRATERGKEAWSRGLAGCDAPRLLQNVAGEFTHKMRAKPVPTLE